jgi:ABC-type transporter Mla subunit MlaD
MTLTETAAAPSEVTPAGEFELEPRHEMEARVQAALDEAQAEVEVARAAESEASGQVDRSREELAMGRATRSVVLRAQRVLAAAQEATAVADAKVRSVERWAAASRESRATLERQARHAADASALAEASALAATTASTLADFVEALEPLAEQAVALRGRLPEREFDRRMFSGTPPLKALVDLGDLIDELDDLRGQMAAAAARGARR